MGVKRRLAIVLTLLGIPLFGYAGLSLLRPSRTLEERELFAGVSYRREFRSSPRPMMIHILRVNLTTPGVSVFVTPGNPNPNRRDAIADTATGFLEQYNLQVAVNGSFFSPHYVQSPLYFYPRRGNEVNVHGLAISEGATYSSPEMGWHPLCILSNNLAHITYYDVCPPETLQALTGTVIVEDHQLRPDLQNVEQASPEETLVVPRTAVAIDNTGETLWLLVVDGHQPFYSEGASLTDLATIMLELGAYQGINLDGGGSSTMVAENNGRAKRLNSPIHTRIPMRERPIANVLGIYAPALE